MLKLMDNSIITQCLGECRKTIWRTVEEIEQFKQTGDRSILICGRCHSEGFKTQSTVSVVARAWQWLRGVFLQAQ